MMTGQLASQRLDDVLRGNEKVLAFGEGISYGIPGMPASLGGADQRVWVAVTPARLIQIRENQIDPRSTVWAEVKWLRVFKQKRKWHYQWLHVTQDSPGAGPYEPVRVEESIARALEDIQSGREPLEPLADEVCIPIRLPRDTSTNLDTLARQRGWAMDSYEYRCLSCKGALIPVTQEPAGLEELGKNRAFLVCQGCLRQPDLSQMRDAPSN